MRLLLRIALVWIVLGLLVGVVLRTRNTRLRPLLVLSFVPWLLHQLYSLVTLEFTLPNPQLILFLGISLLLTLIAAGLAWFYAKRSSPALASLPFLHAVAYSLLLWTLAEFTQTDGLGLNTISWVVFASSVLFMTSLLFSYLLRFTPPKLPGFSLRRKK
jgi:hypothetical protein